MSCLFQAFSKVLKTPHTTIRKECCQFLENNGVLFEGKNGSAEEILSSFSEPLSYVNNMKKTSTWGGGIEIRAVCELYNVAVEVHHKDFKINFFPLNQNSTQYKTIFLDYNGSHYEPCRKNFK